MTVTWNKSQHTSFLLWDIDREFQNAYELYEQLQSKCGRKRSAWSRLAIKSPDDVLAKALNLGREVKNLMETGTRRFGARFEEGDGLSELEQSLARTDFSRNMSHHSRSTAHPHTV
jgi:hypothetical protein